MEERRDRQRSTIMKGTEMERTEEVKGEAGENGTN
jgi:hypothetical protein